jgi:hypothetical protein
MRRGLVLSVVDLVLVSLLLGIYGSTPWAWLAGPVSALAIWCLDCSAQAPRPQPSRPRTAAVELKTSASRG